MTQYYRINDLWIKRGNMKLGTDTLIYSLSSATNCISKHLGLCKLPDFCYALRDEKQYPNVLPYRVHQNIYFDKNSMTTIKSDFTTLFSEHKTLRSQVKYLRWNEAGDFTTQVILDKAVAVSEFLHKKFNVVSYTYSCRSDLIFPDVKWFLVKGSNCMLPNGMSKVFNTSDAVPHDFVVCPTTCYSCKICKTPNRKNLAFVLHGFKNTSAFKNY